MRAWSVVFALSYFLCGGLAQALDDTAPVLRWGIMGGLSGTLPIGDLRAADAQRDEFARALWVDLEPLQFDLGEHWNLSPVVRFVWLGGVDTKALEAALDATRRRDAMGKQLDDPKASALELGAKARYFPWGAGRWRPYAALGLGYTTLGASYTATAPVAPAAPAAAAAPVAPAAPAAAAAPQLHVHRHQGIATKLSLGVRYDAPLRVFNTDMLLPVALELSYTHNTWLALDRAASLETNSSLLAGRRPFVDYFGASLTVGFLR